MIVVIATAWDSAAGGISAFNIQLVRALARAAPNKVACVILATDNAATPREEGGVILVPVPAGGDKDRPDEDCGTALVAALRSLSVTTPVTHWIGHDTITGPAAVIASERYGGQTVIIHHMDYLAYQNFGGGRGNDTTANHAKQIALFTRADLAIGVGVRLTQTARELGAKRTATIVPGFPDIIAPAARKLAPLVAVTAGRFGPKSEPVKQSRLAVTAFGRALQRGGSNVASLATATMIALGTDGIEQQADLEALAASEAGRAVNLVPADFDPDPAAVATYMSRANLAIMPSRHEGFGLIGWEAIGTGTPLILGDDTGLAAQLKSTLDVDADGWVQMLPWARDDRDGDAVAEAILTVARDIPRAFRKAQRLRDALVAELGCSWDDAAASLLAALDPAVTRATATAGRVACATQLKGRALNHFPDCVELALAAGQGATANSIELIAELRFGMTELDIDGVEAEIALTRARLRVVPDQGRLDGPRLGDPVRPAAGIEARAGGVWLLSSDDGPLRAKLLGDEALCRIEAPSEQIAGAHVEVTAAKRDLSCKMRRGGKRLNTTTEKVLGVFLKAASFKDDSGHVILSSARIGGTSDAD